ncbi:MAG: TerC family protein [Bacteroidia bacterium]|nr:TerC family protein [Bacteroidia bacterium]MDW8235148.1 TerC family protein [Bacteroidia bacterium]
MEHKFWEWGFGLFTLVLMELALGIDNLVFLSILTSGAEEAQRKAIWRFWMVYSPLLRVALLLGLVQLLSLSGSWFSFRGHTYGLRELLLIGGGLFLLYKGVKEIHHRLEVAAQEVPIIRKASFRQVLLQVALVDMVFSVDSVLTAIGMTRDFWIMTSAVVISLLFMVAAGKKVQSILNEHPTLKVLALAFLLMIGVSLIGEGTGLHIPRGYIYFAMLFSTSVEVLNIKLGTRAEI